MMPQAMARPIEPTPPLSGEDAEELLASLEKVASPEEVEKRLEAAKRYLADVKRPKVLSRRPPKEPSDR
ncbi:hypothetical protein E8A74_47520 [Polyangium fumosum]|uniref:Uncharacterized protein n=1 Tax=Polyangium fumosum TaxID=889272 RepID=A0A4U1IMM3_9BACT|nr:hypothetical protein E8A74_47520 [Polyangium fumosum]